MEGLEGLPTVRFKGQEVLLDAYAAVEDYIYFLSVVGPREAVRAVLAAWVRGGEDLFVKGERYPGRWSPDRRFRVERLAGKSYHGIGYVEGHYYAREADEKAERLWVSRAYGVPIPEEKGIWQDVRELLLMEGWNMVGLRAPGYLDALEIKGILKRLKDEEPPAL
jgi:hypothetical protein